MLGTAESHVQAPLNDPNQEIWGCGEPSDYVTHAERWFDVHRLDGYSPEWQEGWRKAIADKKKVTVLPTPVVGETVTVFKSATASGKVYTTDATDVTLSAGGERTITLDAQGAMFKLLAVTTTRWVVIASNNATIA